MPHDTPFLFTYLILNITYFLLMDIFNIPITHTLLMSYIDTQGMSLPSNDTVSSSDIQYKPMPVKKMTIFNDREREEIKQMMREVLNEYL